MDTAIITIQDPCKFIKMIKILINFAVQPLYVVFRKNISKFDFYSFLAEKTQIQPNLKSANWTQTKELVKTTINAGTIMLRDILANYSAGEDALETGNLFV